MTTPSSSTFSSDNTALRNELLLLGKKRKLDYATNWEAFLTNSLRKSFDDSPMPLKIMIAVFSIFTLIGDLFCNLFNFTLVNTGRLFVNVFFKKGLSKEEEQTYQTFLQMAHLAPQQQIMTENIENQQKQREDLLEQTEIVTTQYISLKEPKCKSLQEDLVNIEQEIQKKQTEQKSKEDDLKYHKEEQDKRDQWKKDREYGWFSWAKTVGKKAWYRRSTPLSNYFYNLCYLEDEELKKKINEIEAEIVTLKKEINTLQTQLTKNQESLEKEENILTSLKEQPQ